jgi:hypothetical protein
MAKGEYSYLTAGTFITVIGIIIVILVIFKIVRDVKALNDGKKETQKIAREVPMCPDYFEAVSPNKCRNIHKLGKCGHNRDIDFSDDSFTNERVGNIMKCRYANACDLSWEGIDKLC